MYTVEVGGGRDGSAWVTLMHSISEPGELEVAPGTDDVLTLPATDERPFAIRLDAEGR